MYGLWPRKALQQLHVLNEAAPVVQGRGLPDHHLGLVGSCYRFQKRETKEVNAVAKIKRNFVCSHASDAVGTIFQAISAEDLSGMPRQFHSFLHLSASIAHIGTQDCNYDPSKRPLQIRKALHLNQEML